MNIILASGSPRRHELLAQMGVVFTVIPSNYTEQLDDARSPEIVAQELALGKALDVAKDYPGALVIGGDTIVTIDGKQLAKPADEQEAISMLTMLAGKTNYVTTGIALVYIDGNVRIQASDTAAVTFKPYDKHAIESYVREHKPFDKAGGYGIQSGAAPLIAHIRGEYDTIVGLPTKLLAGKLHELGISCNHVALQPVVPILA